MSAAWFLLLALPACGFVFLFWTLGMLALWPIDRAGGLQQRLSRFGTSTLLRLSRVSWLLELAAPLGGGPYVLVSNHSSPLDVFVLVASLRLPFRIAVKDSLYRHPLLWPLIGSGRHVRLGQIGGVRAALGMLRRGECSLLIFPEGEFSKHSVGEFRLGAAYLAVRAGIPAVPMALVGVREIFTQGLAGLRSGQVRVRLGVPIQTRGLTRADVPGLAQKLRQEVEILLQERALTDSP